MRHEDRKSMDRMSQEKRRETAVEILGGGAPCVTHVELTFEDESDQEQDISCDLKSEEYKSVDHVNISNKCDSTVDGRRAMTVLPINSQSFDDTTSEENSQEGKESFNFKLQHIEIEDDVELATNRSTASRSRRSLPARACALAARGKYAGTCSSSVTPLSLSKTKKRNQVTQYGCPCGDCSGGLGVPIVATKVKKQPYETDRKWWERVKRWPYQKYRMLSLPPSAEPCDPNATEVKVKVPRDQTERGPAAIVEKQTSPSEQNSSAQGGASDKGQDVSQLDGRTDGSALVSQYVPVVTYIPYVSYVQSVTQPASALVRALTSPPLYAACASLPQTDNSPIIIID